MPRLDDRGIDGLFREALDERAQALMPLVGGEPEMTERLEAAVGRRRARRQVAWVLLAAALVVALTLAAAVGSGLVKLPVVAVASPSVSPSGTPATPTASPLAATVPTDQLSSPGQLLVCDSLTYPPVAFSDAQGNPAGADIDIFAAISQRLGLQLKVVNARFTDGASQHEAATDGTCDIIVWDYSPPVPQDAVGWADVIRFLNLGGGTDFEAMSVPVEKQGLRDAVDAALLSLADDGTYAQILQGWGLQEDRMCPDDMKPNGGFPIGACLLPATPSPPAPSTPALSVSPWHQVEPNPLANLGEPYALAWSSTRFVVAGVVTGPGFSYAHPNVQFWTSPDGQTWSLSPVASTGYPQAYAFDGSAGVAVGSDGSQAAIWTSPDSQTWTRLPNPPALTLSGQEVGLQLADVVHGPAGYVAVGQLAVRPNPSETLGEALVLWSPDGRDWQRVPMGPFGDTSLTDLKDVIAVAGRYVISGAQHGSPGVPGPTLWTSTDGRSWTAEPAISDGPSGFTELVAGPHGALLAGYKPGALRSSQSCVLWASSDGLAWTPIGDCPEGLGSPGLVATPFGFAATEAVVGAPPAQFTCDGGVQVSVTGARWTCVPPPPSGSLPPAAIVAASQDQIVVVEGGIWIADVAAHP